MRQGPPEKPSAWHLANSDISSRVVTVTGSGDWGQLPVSTERAAVPVNQLPERFGQFVEQLAQELQVPLDLVLVLALALMSGCTRGRFDVEGHWREPSLSLYSAVFLAPGERKSPTLGYLAKPLRDYEEQLRVSAAPEVSRAQETRERLTEQLKRARTDHLRNPQDVDTLAEYEKVQAQFNELKVPKLPQLTSGDVTPEKLAVVLDEQGESLTLLAAEGGLISILQGAYNDGRSNLDLVNSCYSAEPVTVDRQSRDSVRLSKPHLAIVLAIQPDVLRQMQEHREMRERGFLDRFLFAVPNPKVGTRQLRAPRMAAELGDWWHKRLTALLSVSTDMLHAGERRTLNLTEEALNLYEPWWTSLERQCGETGNLAVVSSWVSKALGGALRIAALLELLSDPRATQVQQTSLASAIAITDYLVTHALYVFGDPVTGPTAHTLAAVRRHSNDTFTARDMLRKLQGRTWCKHAENVETELAKLAHLGYVRMLPREPGKKGHKWERHPLLHD